MPPQHSLPQRLKVEPSFEEALASPLAFLRRYLPHLCTKPFHSAHSVIESDIQGGVRFGNYLLPREHGKTTVWIIGYTLYRLALWQWLINSYRERGLEIPDELIDEHICIVSVTQDVADARIRQIKLELETNRRLIEDFHFRRGQIWTLNSFILDGARQTKDPTVFAMGAGGVAPGWRLTCLLMDDITDPLQAPNLEYREKLMHNYDSVLSMMILESGCAFNFQTPYDADDFPFRLQKRGAVLEVNDELDPIVVYGEEGGAPLIRGRHDLKGWISRTWKALIDEANGVVLWPEVWSLDRLLRKRRDNPLTFAQQMQCEPTDLSQVAMPRAKYWDLEYRAADGQFRPAHTLVRQGGYWYMNGERLRILIGVDPASKGMELKKGSRMAIVTVGVSPAEFFILEALLGRWGFTDGCIKVEQAIMRWGAEAAYIEEVNFSNAYRAVLVDSSHLPVYGVPAEGDKFQRIQATIHPQAYNGKIWLKSDQHELVQEWTLFPGIELVDGLDGMEIALRQVIHGGTNSLPGRARRMRGAQAGHVTNIRTRY
ncbi:MAG TPA: hypothetical protein VNI57_01395 [Candidatus Saccharimonadales bacterium]|nr:hypothetical protein [Candidatus Saccharimonadales bacterium]